MNKIKILGNEISDLIAAGEVVERPASVVKELVENSIDAGAKKITIEIKGNGTECIRVTDNGCGMSKEDAKTAFYKHATSKISSKSDLYSIKTLGFRGEALAAISAVSKINLKTKESNSVSGYFVLLEGGTMIDEGEIGTADGTVIEVSQLFYNTPARLKFIKSEQSERAVITSLVEKLAISNTDISFTYTVNGNPRFITSGNGKLADAVYSVFGTDLADDMIPVQCEEAGISVCGLTGKPLANKPNRNYQLFFVNGRLVRSKTLQQSLEMSYKNSMMVGRYPVCALFININTTDIDVNVHPSKLEIKFSDDKLVYNVLSKGVRAALSSESGVYKINIDNKKTDNTPSLSSQDAEPYQHIASAPIIFDKPEPEVKQIKDVKKINDWEITTYTTTNPVKSSARSNPSVYKDNNPIRSTSGILQSDPLHSMAVIKQFVDKNNLDIDAEQISKAVLSKELLSQNEAEIVKTDVEQKDEPKLAETGEIPIIEQDVPLYNFVGEAFGTYIIIEMGEELIFIDKHALHERMIFEKIRSTDFVEVQTLLVPKLLFLSEADSAVLLENKDELKKIGFDYEDFGGSLMLREIPVVLETADTEVLLTEIASELRVKQTVGTDLLDKFLYSIACKAAIKSGDRSSEKELRSLIDEYLKKRSTLKYCPHGRPIVFSLTKKAIEKQFKRIVG